MKKFALLSVFDKTGIIELAGKLHKLGYKIISTGGTAKILSDNKIPVIPVSEITGNPESFDGRMKTISFQIEGGILYDRRNPVHVKQAKALNIKLIDIVICNLYPFEQKQTIENIDVGGPTMIRAAAKNYKNVLVIVDPRDYKDITLMIRIIRVPVQKRKELAAKAFAHLSFYDSQIARFLSNQMFPDELTIPGRKAIDLRYGENPHQKASVYFTPNTNSVLQNLKKLWGRELSLTNLTDINAGLEAVRLFKEPAAVVIKHNSPCGIALGKNPSEALKRAIEADAESAFGGVIVMNCKMDIKGAMEISKFKDERKANIDIVALPAIDKNAFKLLTLVRKSMGIYAFGKLKVQSSKSSNL